MPRTWAGLRLGVEDAAEVGPQRRDAKRRVPQHNVVHRVLVDLALAAPQAWKMWSQACQAFHEQLAVTHLLGMGAAAGHTIMTSSNKSTVACL